MNGNVTKCNYIVTLQSPRTRNVTGIYFIIYNLFTHKTSSSFDSSYLATLARERSKMKPRCGLVAYPALLVHLQL